ncbi:NXPE family member 3-like [Lethenteron reissneri]|uniref:NXPE family member 3-like n=1 Tax=Lethenteron reissneri TaxID=7753 RepID=UPI002AB6060B|nr:NXPE family member 3-like [Lethenteron reissneri]
MGDKNDMCSPLPLEDLSRFANDPKQLGTYPDVTVPCHDRLTLESTLSDLDGTTSHKGSSFKILDPNREYHVGDVLTVHVQTKDYRGRAKGHGGDFLIGRVFSEKRMSSAIGVLEDHSNGTYTLSFVLRWPGVTNVDVLFVHSSEAVAALEVVREAFPVKIQFWGIFGVNKASQETMECGARLLTKGRKLCNLTEPVLGEPWLCYEPQHVPCTSLQWFFSNNTVYSLSKEHEELFTRNRSLLLTSSRSASYTLRHCRCARLSMLALYIDPVCLPAVQEHLLPVCGGIQKDKSKADAFRANELKSRVLQLGYYLNREWQPANCKGRRFLKAEQVTACLRRRNIYLLGDSTVRQWYNILVDSAMPTLKQLNLHIPTIHQPGLAVDPQNDILLRYIPHGYPYFCSQLQRVKDFRHVALEVDAISGGPMTAVAVSLGAHFVPFPLVDASRRLLNVRAAILRLIARSPQTTIVIKTINMRETDINLASFSNWLAFRIWALTQRVFMDLPVVIIDAWEMTASLNSYNLHPAEWIVHNEVDLFLAHVCPT